MILSYFLDVLRCNGSVPADLREFQYLLPVHSQILPQMKPSVLTVDTEALSTTTALPVCFRVGNSGETPQEWFCDDRCTLSPNSSTVCC